jgi:hypothetical protein
MRRLSAHRFHKWVAVVVSAFLVAWLVSGIMMVLPAWGPGDGPTPSAALDLREVSVSPAEAAAVSGNGEPLSSVTLVRFLDGPVYRVAASDGTRLVDARIGRLLLITPKVAEQAARARFSPDGPVRDVQLVTRHSVAYPWGPVPAYRIVFGSSPSTAYYVSTADGAVQRSDPWIWTRDAIISLHSFEPLKLFTRREPVRTGLLVLMSLVGLVTAASGLYLALRR